MAWLRLVRWKNLLIVFLTQLLIWWCVLLPMQRFLHLNLLLHTVNFLCISLSTVFIAAAGYIINDYFDIKIDIINRPEKVVLEKRIPRRMAILSHSALNILALVLAAIVAIQVHHPEWLALQLCCTVLLWFYSTHFKRQFMTGNVVVALLTALTIVTLLLYEPSLHSYITQPAFLDDFTEYRIPNPVWVLGVYAYFAFVLTWMREIVKDMEDFKGDAEQGCITMPIKWGLLRSVRFTQGLAFFAVVPLLIASVRLCLSSWWPLGTYTAAALIVPIIYLAIQLPKKATSQHYHNASRQLKIIMVLGIGSLIIYFFQAWIRSF
ncbi:geranylgeranylglycerol-phosphate geranylgeranyltransferase [Chitinophagaceae bacterium MMS25-I14]